MWKKAKITDQTATGQGPDDEQDRSQKTVGIKKKSKVPGVMITQYIEELPEGKKTPDFLRKPIALTIQEGKLAIFKARVTGDPKPVVTWSRATGDMSDREKFQNKYNEGTKEYTLEIPRVSSEEADTYKCYAHNEFGQAICTAALNIIEVGFKRKKAMLKTATTDPSEFRKLLRKSKGHDKPVEKKDGEFDEKFWEILMSADKKDYERICAEYGVTNFRWMLKKLNERKQEREEEQKKYIECISNLKHIEVKGEGYASFELDLELKDPNSRIFLYKDGVMIKFNSTDEDTDLKHSLKRCGKNLKFTVRDLMPEDAGLYQVDVEEVNIFSTDFKIPIVDFIVKIQEVKAMEREDVVFECVLSHPLPRIRWMGKNMALEVGDKYSITVSEDRLIHRLLVKDCMQLDKGIYSATAGIKTCSAWLMVEADNDATRGKKAARKTTQAGRTGLDLEKLAEEQQTKLLKEKEEVEKLKKLKEQQDSGHGGGSGLGGAGTGVGGAGTGLGGAGSGLGGAGDGSGLGGAGDGTRLGGVGDASGLGGTGDGSGLGGAGDGTGLDGGGSGLGGAGDGTGLDGGGSGLGGAGDGSGLGGTGDGSGLGGAGDGTGLDGGGSGLGGAGDGSGLGGTGDGSGLGGAGDGSGLGGTGDGSGLGGAGDGSGLDGGGSGLGGAGDGTGLDGGGSGLGGAGDGTGLDGGGSGLGGAGDGTGLDGGGSGLGGAGDGTGLDGGGSGLGGAGDGSGLGGAGDGSGLKGKKSKKAKDGGSGWTEVKEEPKTNQNKEPAPQVTATETEGDGERAKRTGELVPDEGIDTNAQKEPAESVEQTKRRTRQDLWLAETVTDPGVQFITGLSNVDALMGQTAELMCKLSSDNCDGVWYKDGKQVTQDDGLIISQDGACHRLIINNCREDDTGKYRFEADGRKTEAMITVLDPPRFDPDDLAKFSEPVIVRAGQNATFKLPFVGCEPMKIQWYREDVELLDDTNVKMEKSPTHSRLILSKCQRRETGEIKIRLNNDFGSIETCSRLIVLVKPSPPQGPVEVVEASASAVEIKWKPPKDDGGCPVINYNLERQQVGRNTWNKIGDIPGDPSYKDKDVDHGKKYCYRIRAITAEGISELIETNDITAGTLEFPGPTAPPKVVSALSDCISLSWAAPANTGGSRIYGYNLEKRKKGSNLWSAVNPADEPIQDKKYSVKDVVTGMEYEFRVSAINISGAGEPSNPSEFVIARDPKKPPAKVIDLKVTDTSYANFSLTWTKPTEQAGVQDEAKGYFVEIRSADSIDWVRTNATPITLTSFTVKGLKAMAMYWARVTATNDGGDGVPQDLDHYILAMPPPVRPRLTNHNLKSFMVARAGNSVRITVNFEASPRPRVDWLKDGVPVSKRVTISQSDGTSQLLIPSSERTDTGVYTSVVKNLVGQESFSVEVRVTDDPKPPGPVGLEENVPDTVTVTWEPSLDEKRDDRLHYMVWQRDSTKQTWHTVADRLFNNKFTACNIMQGREYHFRVYAKNDMGMSAPSESPTWGTQRKREKIVVNMTNHKERDFRCAPTFLAPLKFHTALSGYELYMTCAVRGNPKPCITWYRNNASLNTNTNYLITNTCGVCSMLILRVGPKDTGEYTIAAENQLGRAECSTKLTVRE